MRAIQALFFAVLLVVLTSIAIDLHRIARWRFPTAPSPSAALVTRPLANETREQRIERMAKEINESADEFKDTLEASMRLARGTKQRPDQRPR